MVPCVLTLCQVRLFVNQGMAEQHAHFIPFLSKPGKAFSWALVAQLLSELCPAVAMLKG